MSHKKLLLTIVILLCGVNYVFSQNDNMNTPQFVSTEPSLKNVVIEEFTGRNCHACPAGHKKANELMRTYPGRVSVIT